MPSEVITVYRCTATHRECSSCMRDGDDSRRLYPYQQMQTKVVSTRNAFCDHMNAILRGGDVRCVERPEKRPPAAINNEKLNELIALGEFSLKPRNTECICADWVNWIRYVDGVRQSPNGKGPHYSPEFGSFDDMPSVPDLVGLGILNYL